MSPCVYRHRYHVVYEDGDTEDLTAQEVETLRKCVPCTHPHINTRACCADTEHILYERRVHAKLRRTCKMRTTFCEPPFGIRMRVVNLRTICRIVHSFQGHVACMKSSFVSRGEDISRCMIKYVRRCGTFTEMRACSFDVTWS